MITTSTNSSCYLCSRVPAANPLDLSKSFTNHSVARCPRSENLCDRCYGAIAGKEKQMYYWNPNKNQWSKIWGRSLSRLYQGDKLLCPTIEGEREGLLVVKDLATREAIRGWLLEPPSPPFTIAIAVSGQKHILPFAIQAEDRDRFPVQFETESLWVEREKFASLLQDYQALMALGFSKAEITSGDYRSDRLVAAIDSGFDSHEQAIASSRGSGLLLLAEHVA